MRKKELSGWLIIMMMMMMMRDKGLPGLREEEEEDGQSLGDAGSRLEDGESVYKSAV